MRAGAGGAPRHTGTDRLNEPLTNSRISGKAVGVDFILSVGEKDMVMRAPGVRKGSREVASDSVHVVAVLNDSRQGFGHTWYNAQRRPLPMERVVHGRSAL